MAKKKSVPLQQPGIDWSSPVGDFEPLAPAAPPAEDVPAPSGVMRRAGDVGLSLLKGAIGVPESIVGMADLVSGGQAGKLLENEGGDIGFRPKEAKAVIDQWMSPEARAAQDKFTKTDGVLDAVSTAVSNPSLIVNAGAESLPVMGMGGAIGRGVLAVAPRVSGALAGALGEGAVTMGSQAEGIRQETGNGLLTGQQAGIAAASGALTGVLGVIGGKVAAKLGIHDVDAMLAGKGGPEIQKAFSRRVLEGAVSEGLLEELPQSIQEQVATNLALGKPLDEGVVQSAVLGALTGGVMGGGANVFSAGDAVRAEKVPEVGPMSKAANAGLEAQAQTLDAAGPPPAAPAPPAPEAAAELLQHANERAAELTEKAKGTKDETVTGADGEKVVVPGTPAQFLTPDEKAEQQFLQENGGDAGALAQVYEVPAVDQAAARAQREADRPPEPEGEVQDGDILNRVGAPFTTMTGAMGAARKAGDGHEIVPVKGGLVVRRAATVNPQPTTLGERVDALPDNAPGFTAENTLPKPAPVEAAAPEPVPAPAPAAEAPAEKPATVAALQEPAGEVEKPVDLSSRGKSSANTPTASPAPKPQGTPKAADRWAVFMPVEREAALLAAGWKKGSPSTQDLQTKSWEALSRSQQNRIAEALDAQAQPKEEATDGPKQPTAAVPEADAAPAQQEGADRRGAGPAEGTEGAATGIDTAGGADAQSRLVDAAAWWDGATSTERDKIAADMGYARNGVLTPIGKRIASRLWKGLAQAVQEKIAKAAPAKAAAVLEEPKSQPGARRGAYNVDSGTGTRTRVEVLENATPGEFTVRQTAASMGQQAEVLGTFRVSDTGRAAAIKPRWGWAEAPVRQAAEQFVAQQAKPATAEAAEAAQPAPTVPVERATLQPTPKQVRDFGIAMRAEGLEMDGLDARRWSMAGESFEVHAQIDAGVAQPVVRMYRLEGGEEVSSTSTIASRATEAVRELIGDVAAAPAEKPKASANTIFTEDAAEKARALLKRKIGQLNSGIDPEILQAGITLAGYHIERGARTFAAYAKAMLADLGDGVQPYLKSWYMGVKYDPRAAAFDGMSSAAEVEAATFDEGAGTGPNAEPPATVADTPTESPANAADDAGNLQPQDVPAADAGSRPGDGQPGGGDRQPVDAGVAGQGEGPAEVGRVPAGAEGPAGERSDGQREGGRPDAPGTARDQRAVRPEPGAAGTDSQRGLSDHTIDDEDGVGEGGQAAKFRANMRAIEIAKAIDAEGRASTPDERKELAKYVGWGGMKGVFDAGNKGWARQHEQLKAALTDAEWKAASKSQRNAHYTSVPVVKAIYSALGTMGFSGGRVLEPSVGVGNFFGLMPAPVRNASRLHGVELDAMTSLIVRHLYPTAKIAGSTGFQSYQVPAEYFDLVIGNPPFGSEPLVDGEGTAYSGWSIHNYFFGKAIDKVRPGGIVAMVVSHNLMDRLNPEMRRWMGERAELVDAVRLPNTAFKDNANTEVVTDVLLFKRLADGDKAQANTEWLDTVTQTVTNPKTGETAEIEVNRFFANHPEKVLGTPSAAGTMYRANEYTVEAAGDWQQGLKDWAAKVPASVYTPIERTRDELDSADNAIPDGVKVGGFFVAEGGVVRQRIPDTLGTRRSQEWTAPNGKSDERMRGMIELRTALREQMRLERDPSATEQAVEAHRKALDKRYDAFVAKHGHLNADANRRIFVDDTEAALLQALEFDYDAGVSRTVAAKEGLEVRPPKAVKADILSRRVLFPPAEDLTVSSARDALLASLNERGRVDIDYMRSTYDKSEAEIEAELGDMVYRNPATGAMVMHDEYLSGDVKTKLAEARKAAEADKAYERNVAALEKIIPADKMPSEIYASPGVAWIPPKVYEDFMREITGGKATVRYVKATAQWLVGDTTGADVGKTAGEFGTPKMPAQTIMGLLLNGRPVEVKKRVMIDGRETYVTDEEQTEAARAKAAKVKAHWESWVWADPDRAVQLAGIYNDKHNRTVERAFDGSHLSFPGMSPAIRLLAHQKDAVWRGLQDRNMLLDHVVGAGKTFEMATLAMEMRRLGIARKPFFVVPNHLTLQWRGEFARLYPGANVLAATPADFSKDNRKKLFSKIATGNWDAVIVGHSSLKKIGLPEGAEAKIVGEQLQDIADAIEDLKRERGDRNVIRDMEGIKARLEARMERQKEKTGTKDDVVSFEDLGTDALFIDEMHEFKNLFFTTQMQRVSGLGNPSGSGKAFDLFVKVRWLQETFGEQAPLVTATGTPVSNSLSEMFTMQRFMRYPELRRDGLHLFDAWAKQYGDVESVYEVAPSGVGYRISQRFSKFRNLPSLMGHYRSFADVVTLDDLKQQEAAAGKRFPVPKIKGGRPLNVVVQRSQLQTDFFGVPKVVRSDAGEIQFELQDPTKATIEAVPADPKMGRSEQTWAIRAGGATLKSGISTETEAREQLVAMATTPRTELDPKSLLGQFANLRELTRNTKGKINALSLTGLANKAGLDYRLIDPGAPDHPGSKINKAVENIVKVWKDTAGDRGTQLVFCDMSVPLSARASMASKPKRAFVRDSEGRVTHKQATLHAIDGWEGYPFYMVKSERGIAVYEPVSGVMLRDGFADKAAVNAWASGLLSEEKNREKWLDARDRYGELTDDQISEYRDQKELETEPDGSNELSRADLEAVAGASTFSVYDDMKAKLVAAGIPAAEIEFVHDHDTPSAKDKLFKRVKAGTVRVLFGSTPKMGAGTNVQDRLVGLHHVDAPWRPSDLEQREGRIIRRGNLLYERDPDGFEVFIGRYATEQTYDTRRWQLLEHKAAGIEQLRNYAGQAEIEDVASEAANAADMKAAASGNPLILQETHLRTEVRRLESLEKAHKDNVLTMARRAADQQQYAERYGPEKLKGLRALVADRNAAPFDPENPVARIGGKAYTGKEAIQKRLAFVMAEMQTSTGSDAVVAVEYRGLPFFFKGGANMVSVEGPAGHIHSYGKNETVSSAGLLTRLGNAAERLDAHVVDVERHIARAAAEATTLRKQSQEPFADGQLLKDTKAKHGVVQRNLMKASQGEAVSPAERGEFNEAIKGRRATLEGMGFGAELKASDAADVAFSRSNGLQPATGRMEEVQALADVIARRWANAPEIVVVDDMNDPSIPDAVRSADSMQQSQGAAGTPEGFFHDGKVYLLASQLPGDAHVVRVLFHEALGHYGLRGTFGDGLGEILDNLARLNAGKVREKAKQYGLDYEAPADRRMAAEEVLAEMAQKSPTTGWVQRAVAAVRTALRRFVPGFGKMALSDAEIIRDYILPARAFVQRGGPAGGPGGGVAFSRSPLEALRSIDQKSVRNAFLDATTSHASTSLWGRTVGTQYAKAKNHPDTFGRVFDAVQDYIKDTSVFANAAADEAPSLLPKLDRLSDLWKDGLLRHGADPKDVERAAQAIFEGTLADKIYTDDELRTEFGLSDKQAGLYREFRKAVDQSLTDMAKSEIVRIAGKEGVRVAQRTLAAADVHEAAALMNEELQRQAAELDRPLLLERAAEIERKTSQVADLMARGYAPLMRFGKHTVTVTGKEGGVEFFSMYESLPAANRAARLLREDPAFEGASVTQGVMSAEGHRLFSGVSLDSLELFAEATGNADNEVYQAYLKLATSNRSALRRMIERKGIAGFSQDATRVLASFVTSNARMAAGNLHLGEAKKAAEAIPKEQGDLRDDAIKLVDYVTKPQEEAAAARALLFTTFIGGSVASAAVNLTQPLTMTLPFLSQFGGAVKAGKRILAAAASVAAGKHPAAMAEALQRAEADGIVSPQEIHHLQAEAMNAVGKHPMLKKAAFLWGSLFSLSEQFNRRVSFVAAYNTALEQDIDDPFTFAEQAVIETQGLYNRGNKANWARGPVGATVMTFKQFSTHYLEFLTRMWKSGPEGKKAVGVALAMLMLAGGADGLPFADDLNDLVDTIGQALGYDMNSKRWKREFIAKHLGLGDTAAEVATRGLTALPGFPMDLSLRMGMGNLLPATGLFLRSNTDASRDLLEVAGAAGGLAKMAMTGTTKLLQGDVAGAGMAVAPVAIQNMAKALGMWDTGEYRDTKGRKVMDVDAVDGAMKFVGFQPAAVARESSRIGETQRTVQLAKNVEGELAGKWAQAQADGDSEGVKAAQQAIADWNTKNPTAQIKVTRTQILQRVRALKSSRADRAVKAAPKELRGAVGEALS